ncbi:hypothetical protein EVAR_9101_1 [Eumeta japonica]|uniref:Uncharacterized protein n=1 Tax=Eumeta variegata TaxID=151549 RepID=A0A4C1TWF8_EUMVA|nr:hypothetical protein EVAR_9101_1 [Eumeta japonica]
MFRPNRTYFLILVLILSCTADPSPQLNLPPISSTQRNPYAGYGLLSNPQMSINSPGNQFAVSPNPNFQLNSVRPTLSTLGNFPVSSTPSLNPSINNNGYPNLDYGNGLQNNQNVQGSSTLRPFDNRNRDDRIDVNNDPNFRRNDPNFVRNDPNYVGANPYDFNRGLNANFPGTNAIDDRVYQVNMQEIRNFLLQADDQASTECTNNVAAQWNFETNVNEATQHAAHNLKREERWRECLHVSASQLPRDSALSVWFGRVQTKDTPHNTGI